MNRNLLTGILVTALLSAVFLVTFFFLRINTKQVRAVNIIPDNAAFAIECRKLSLNFSLFSQKKFWKQLLEDEVVSNVGATLNLMDSLLNNSVFENWKEDCNTVVSFHPYGNGSVDVLLLVETQREYDLQDMLDWFNKTYENRLQLSRRRFDGEVIYDFTDFNTRKTFSLAYKNKVFMLSFNGTLVEETLFKCKRSKVYEQSVLDKLDYVKSLGEANVYVNYRNLPTFLSVFMDKGEANVFSPLSRFATWSVLGTSFEDNAINFSGVSITHDSLFQFADVFNGSAPSEHNIKKILPSNTGYYLGLSWSADANFERNLEEYYKVNNLQRQAAANPDSPDITVPLSDAVYEKLHSTFASEVATLYLYNPELTFDSSRVLVVKLSSPEKTRAILEAHADTTYNQTDSSNLILQLKWGNIFRHQWGEILNGVSCDFAFVYGNFLICAGNAKVLRNFHSHLLAGDLLNRQADYNEHQGGLDAISNVEFFVNGDLFTHALNELAAPGFKNEFSTHKSTFRKARYFSFQLGSASDKSFACKGQLYFDVKEHSRTELLWELNLDSSLAIPPAEVAYSADGENKLLLEDQLNNVYLVNKESKVLWKVPVDSKILGEVQTVDAFHNGKCQYLFNTTRMIYLLDENGKNLQGFPLWIPTGTNYPVSVFDFNRDKTYKIFAVGRYYKIWGFNLQAKLLPGWNPANIWPNPVMPLSSFRYGSSHILYSLNEKGKLLTLAADGKKLNELVVDSSFNFSHAWHESISDTSVRLFLADSTGMLFSKDIGLHSQQPLAPTGKMISRSRIRPDEYGKLFVASNRDKHYVVNGQTFEPGRVSDTLNGRLSVVSIKGKNWFGRLDAQSGTLQLLDTGMKSYPEFPVRAQDFYQFAHLEGEQSLYVIAGAARNKVYLYRLR